MNVSVVKDRLGANFVNVLLDMRLSFCDIDLKGDY